MKRTRFVSGMILAVVFAVLMSLGSVPAAAQYFAYVANQNSNTISVINTATNTVVAAVPVGNRPYEVAITPDGTMAYVTNYNDSTVSVIKTATNTVVATLQVGAGPIGIAITPNGAFAYVAISSSNTIAVIDTATNTVVATVPAGFDPFAQTQSANAVTFSPSGAFAYIGHNQAISIMDTSTNTVVATVPTPTEEGGAGPGMAITPDGAFVYYASSYGNITVVSTASQEVVGNVSTTGNIRGSNLNGVAIAPNGALGYAAVAGFNEVAIFDTTNTVVATVPQPGGPTWVAITPNGAFAYVTNLYANLVSIIDTTTRTEVARVPVGTNPNGVAITPVALKLNQPPVALAGRDQTVECTGHNCAIVTLNGSASSDPDGDALTYQWTDPSNNVVGTTATVTVVAPLGTTAYTLSVTDPSGLGSSATTHITVQDTTPPVLTLSQTGMTVVLATASASGATVNLSGIATATDTCDPSPTVTNNAASLFPVGTTIVTFTATDHSGNQSQKNFSVQVVYNFNGYFMPILNNGASLFQSGRTVPVKFALTAADGTIITNAIANLQVYFVLTTPTGTVDETVNTLASGSSNTGTLFRFDPTSGQYIYNLSTLGFATGTYLLRTTLNDGTTYDAIISIR